MPVADNYKEINVEKEGTDDKSHLKVYKSLQELRKESTLRNGNTKYAALSQQVIAIARYVFIAWSQSKIYSASIQLNRFNFRFLDGEKLYITVVNVGPFVEKVNLNSLGINLPKHLAYHIVGTSSAHKVK